MRGTKFILLSRMRAGFLHPFGRTTVLPVSISDMIVAPTSLVRSFVIGVLVMKG